MITHAVEDFAKWKPAYDAYQLEPSNPRSKGDMVFHSVENPNLVTVLSEFESREDADLMINSEELKNAMRRAGVTSEPEFTFLTKA